MSFAPSRHLKEALAISIMQRRYHLGLSQESLAEKTGFSRVYISLVERQKRAPSLESIFRLCHGLEIDPLDFLAQVVSQQHNLNKRHKVYEINIKPSALAADQQQITALKSSKSD